MLVPGLSSARICYVLHRLTGGKHARGHWDSWDNLAAELADWILARHCEPGPQGAEGSSTSTGQQSRIGTSAPHFPPGAQWLQPLKGEGCIQVQGLACTSWDHALACFDIWCRSVLRDSC